MSKGLPVPTTNSKGDVLLTEEPNRVRDEVRQKAIRLWSVVELPEAFLLPSQWFFVSGVTGRCVLLDCQLTTHQSRDTPRRSVKASDVAYFPGNICRPGWKSSFSMHFTS